MRARWWGPVLAVLVALFAGVVYGRLPAEVPVHWNVAGEVDGWMPRFPGAFLMPLGVLVLWVLALGLPRIDPRREEYERFGETYWLLMNLIMLFVAALGVMTLGAALGWGVDVGRVVTAGVGVLFVALGNFLPRVRPNWWMGVRTPWTLSSERVWARTQRLAGWLFVAAGLAVLLATPLPGEPRMVVLLGGVAVAALVPTIYSYLAWRREQQQP